jgi:O-acetylhomoserine (thiol)-lyase
MIHGRPNLPDAHGALRMPIYDNVAFEFGSSRDIQLAFEGRKPAHSYTRISNPTVEFLEQRLAAASGAMGCVATASGMAAISALVLALGGAGSRVVASRYLFGNTASLLEGTLKPWGLETAWVDMGDLAAVEAALKPGACMLFLESISNPQQQVADLKALSGLAQAAGVPLVVDTTVTPPVGYKPKDLGVDVEVLSTTKFISGGATSMGGAILDLGSFDWKQSPKLAPWAAQAGPLALLAALRREVHRNLGGCLSPHNASLQALGLETLELRVRAAAANALAVARFLEGQPKVLGVNYPGLESHPQHGLARAQFGGLFGGILSFSLADRPACYRLMDQLALIRRATNINDNKTLIIHPASTIFSEFPPLARQQQGVPEGLLRLSLGIENAPDLVDDLAQALEVL